MVEVHMFVIFCIFVYLYCSCFDILWSLVLILVLFVNFSAHVLPFSDEYFPSFFASHNLRVFVDHAIKTVQNRFDQCLETLIDFLNSSLFGANGPHPDLKQYLCPPAHEGNVLKAFLPPGYQGRVFPRSMKDAKNMPIQSRGLIQHNGGPCPVWVWLPKQNQQASRQTQRSWFYNYFKSFKIK